MGKELGGGCRGLSRSWLESTGTLGWGSAGKASSGWAQMLSRQARGHRNGGSKEKDNLQAVL